MTRSYTEAALLGAVHAWYASGMGHSISWVWGLATGVLVSGLVGGCGSDDDGGSGGSAGTSGSAGAGATGGSSGSGASGGAGGSAASGGSPPGCGDSTIGSDEQCDDGATVNLDGCDLACRYELYLRVNAMEIQGGPAPAWCDQQTNGLGSALTDLALGQVNPSLQEGINGGGTNILMQALGLDDLTGAADTSFDLGITTGEPDPAAGTWPANDPIDWSFLLAPATLDAAGVPTQRLTPSALAANVLTAGPSSINLSLTISGSPANLEILNAGVRGRVLATTSTPAPPPAELAPGLAVLEALEANGADEGLCGNVTVDSLAKIAIPEALTDGVAACGDCAGSHVYTYCGEDQPVGPNCNSLLDALVGGCKALVCIQEVIVPTQPDVSPGTPLAVEGALNKIPEAQTNGNKAAYSAFFTFTAKRQKASGKLAQ